MALFTPYKYAPPSVGVPRCKNTHTLSPLFALRTADYQLVTDPVPISEVPPEYFWMNSDGYGFDVRNLAQLLRVNFRNLNPHTIDANAPRPLWCNEADMNALLYHAKLPPTVLQTVKRRSTILNALTDRTKELIATVAGELYSYSYQGFYDWIADQGTVDLETVMQALNMTITRREMMDELARVQARRRRSTIAGIRSHVGVQASEHFCEPAGIDCCGELYSILEWYKAEVVNNTVTYIANLAEKKRDVCQSVQRKLDTYARTRLDAISHRYAVACDRAAYSRQHPKLAQRRRRRPVQVWHIHIGPAGQRSPAATAQTTTAPAPRLYRRRRFGRATAAVTPAPSQNLDVHIRLFYTHATGEFSITINGTPFVPTLPLMNVLADTVPHFLDPRRRWTVVSAAITGQMHQLCRPQARWRPTIRKDNRFLRSVAQGWVTSAPFTQWVEELLTEGSTLPTTPLFMPNAIARAQAIQKRVDPLYRDSVYRQACLHLTKNAQEIFEFRVLNDHITIKGGYDDFSGSLLDKLRAALANRTCIQDVGGELCEMLSLPYPPEHAGLYARFQCDQTNVPPRLEGAGRTAEPVEIGGDAADAEETNQIAEEAIPFAEEANPFAGLLDERSFAEVLHDVLSIEPVVEMEPHAALPSMTPILEESSEGDSPQMMNIQLLLSPPMVQGSLALDL